MRLLFASSVKYIQGKKHPLRHSGNTSHVYISLPHHYQETLLVLPMVIQLVIPKLLGLHIELLLADVLPSPLLLLTIEAIHHWKPPQDVVLWLTLLEFRSGEVYN